MIANDCQSFPDILPGQREPGPVVTLFTEGAMLEDSRHTTCNTPVRLILRRSRVPIPLDREPGGMSFHP